MGGYDLKYPSLPPSPPCPTSIKDSAALTLRLRPLLRNVPPCGEFLNTSLLNPANRNGAGMGEGDEDGGRGGGQGRRRNQGRADRLAPGGCQNGCVFNKGRRTWAKAELVKKMRVKGAIPSTAPINTGVTYPFCNLNPYVVIDRSIVRGAPGIFSRGARAEIFLYCGSRVGNINPTLAHYHAADPLGPPTKLKCFVNMVQRCK